MHWWDSCFPKSLKLSTGCGFRYKGIAISRPSVPYKDRRCILGHSKNQNYIYSSATNAMHPFSVVSVVEDLAHDWL